MTLILYISISINKKLKLSDLIKILDKILTVFAQFRWRK